ncbi:MAG: prolyl oligopeptidase family serine peptidase, partial [Bacteroidota bacterium]
EQRAANDHYLTNITWSPDEKFIYVAVLNREQDHMLLNKYDAVTGDFVKTLFEEINPKYVEPLNPLFFLNDDATKFIWQSQRDGYNHLYLYDDNGKLIKQLTNGLWVVKELLGVNPDNSVAWFMCNKDEPLGNIPGSVNLNSGESIFLSKVHGTHRVKIAPDGKYLLDSFNNLETANQVVLTDNHGKILETLLENKNPLQDYKLGTTSVFPIKNSDKIDLYCRLIKPVDFDSTKKYPVIIYVYGGPHSQMVTDSWLAGGGLFLNYLADQGYVVFTLDNRGTSNRGLGFEQAIFRNLGTVEVDDQMVGVKFLKSLSYVDTTRIGINGWSYGGFMGLSMMLKNPGVFKTVVVGGPVIDWKYYEVMYGERYMDTPGSNPDGYKNACLLNYVKNLKGKLLILQGYQAGTVVPQNSLSFIKKCLAELMQVDYFIYPGHEHNVRGKNRIHMNQKIVNYFKDYL